MFRLSSPGRLFYTLAVTLIGIQFIIYTDFHSTLFPLQQNFAGRSAIMRSFGIITVVCGFAMGMEKWVEQSVLILSSVLIVILLLIHVPNIFAHPRDSAAWTAAAEGVALICGAFMLPISYRLRKPEKDSERSWFKIAQWSLNIFALTLVVFGIQQFTNTEYYSSLLPAWILLPNFVTYGTGLLFLACAFIFITRRRLQFGAVLLGLTFLSWLFTVNTPRIFAMPRNHAEWTSGFIALAMSGIGLIIGGNVSRKEAESSHHVADADEQHLNAS